MMKRLTNRLRWVGHLMKIDQTTDEDDRPIITRIKVRDIFYSDLGITAQEKYLSQQARADVIRRIEVKFDRSIDEKMNSIRIGEVDYKITRIYTRIDDGIMELSLSYVD